MEIEEMLVTQLTQSSIKRTKDFSNTALDGLISENLFGELNPILERVQEDKDITYIGFYNQDRNLIACSDSSVIDHRDVVRKLSLIEQADSIMVLDESDQIHLYIGITDPGNNYVHIAGHVEGYVYMNASKNIIQIRLKEIFTRVLIKIFVLLSVMLLLVFHFVSKLMRPIVQLKDATIAFSSGNMAHRMNVERDDELGEMAVGFNKMADSLASNFKEIVQSREEAEKLVKIKDEFLSNMSHEIKTPLNAIVGMSELLKSSTSIEKNKKYIRSIHSAGKNLNCLINDILTIVRAQKGELSLETVSINVNTILADIATAHQIETSENGIMLTCHFDLDLDNELVMGDPNRL
ncbi:MAG: HAMP domain-containing protein [Colwellia sp.]|nr:HAMP domain-containing protein [Colwellia sp.]